MLGDVQYVADTILLEETFQVLSELNKPQMEKYAFDLASILPSIGNWVASHTGEQFHNEPNSLLRTIENLVVPGIAFGIHPLLGTLVTIAEFYGYDLTSIYEKIKSAILPDLKEGKPVSAEKINSAAQSAIPAEPNSNENNQEQGEVDDLLYPLRAMRDKGQLTKEALFGIGEGNKKWDTKGNWLNPLKGLLDLFGARRRGSIIVGLLTWFLKTILLSAGLLAVAGAVLPKKNPITGQEPSSTGQSQSAGGSLFGNSVPASTGAGSHVYKNNPGDMWVEELGGLQPHEMVLNWAIQSYPSLYQYKSIILNTPSFWNAVRNITEDWRPGQSEVIIPDPYKSRDDVVKLFIGDVFKNINEGRK